MRNRKSERLSLALLCVVLLLATSSPGMVFAVEGSLVTPPDMETQNALSPSHSPRILPEPSAAPEEGEALSPLMELGGTLFLINQDNKISKTYEPEDLKQPRVKTRKESLKDRILMREEAALALEKMFEAAFMEQGYTLLATSGYRSFGIQQILLASKIEEVGSRDKAIKSVALPGTSEHQLGLAMDIQSPAELNLNARFGETNEGKWVAENAHRFGYIVRYKAEWRSITGVIDEPWHIRYLGIAHATAIHELNMPYETYFKLLKELPAYVVEEGIHPLFIGLLTQLQNNAGQNLIQTLQNAPVADRHEVLKQATMPFLKPGESYEQALWHAHPTPRPTAGPRVDEDEESSVFTDRIFP